MEKVKVTRDQEKAIKDLISTGQRITTINRLLDGEVFFNEFYEPLRKMKPKDIIKSLIDEIGYEVEPDFQINDWITHKVDGTVGKVIKTEPCLRTDNGMGGDPNGFRLSTPEEIKQEKERRTDRKLNELLSTLSNEELSRLREKLKCGLDVNTNE